MNSAPGVAAPGGEVARKACVRCGVEKSFTEFFRSGKGRLSGRCKRCHGVSQKACTVCRAAFEGKPHKRFCSVACRRQARPPTFLACQGCGQTFGPVDRLCRQYCSYTCKCAGQTKAVEDRKPQAKPTPAARRAQRTVKYHVDQGNLVRPTHCEECRRPGKIEGAHFNYDEPLRVRWLCRSCHAKWDWAFPKGGTKETAVRMVAAPVLPLWRGSEARRFVGAAKQASSELDQLLIL